MKVTNENEYDIYASIFIHVSKLPTFMRPPNQEKHIRL